MGGGAEARDDGRVGGDGGGGGGGGGRGDGGREGAGGGGGGGGGVEKVEGGGTVQVPFGLSVRWNSRQWVGVGVGVGGISAHLCHLSIQLGRLVVVLFGQGGG